MAPGVEEALKITQLHFNLICWGNLTHVFTEWPQVSQAYTSPYKSILTPFYIPITVLGVILAVPKFCIISRVVYQRAHELAQFGCFGIYSSCYEWQLPLVTTAVDTQILFGGI